MHHKTRAHKEKRAVKQFKFASLFALCCYLSFVGIGTDLMGCTGKIGDPPKPPTVRTEIIPDQTSPTDDPSTSPDTRTTSPDDTSKDTPTGPDITPPDVKDEVYYADVKPFLERFCVNCHGEGYSPDLMSYTNASHKLKAGELPPVFWQRVYDRIIDLNKSNSMPPRFSQERPTAADQLQEFAVGQALFEKWKAAGYPEKKGGGPSVDPNKGKENPYDVFPTSSTCKGNEPLPARLWRLSALQVNNTLKDVFGTQVPLPTITLSNSETEPPGGNYKKGFSNITANVSLTSIDVTALVQSIGSFANDIVTKHTKWKPCLTATGTTCVKNLVKEYGRLLWRRPLTTAEVDAIAGNFSTLAAAHDRETGLAYALERLIISTNYLYISEQGKVDPGNNTLRRLTSFEVASFLSFAIWQSVPDDTLLKAAEANQLQDLAQVRTQVDRMLQDQKARRGIINFFNDWMKLPYVLEKTKDTSTFPQITSSFKNDLHNATQRYLEYMIWTKKATLQQILTSQETYATKTIASLYSDLSSQSTTPALATFAPNRRRGLLTSPAFLFVQSGDSSTGFVHRGVFFLEQMTCFRFGNPPAMDVINAALKKAKDNGKGKSTRDIMALHANNENCRSCHQIIDPVGAAFELFDPLGRYRTEENGKPIDAKGTLAGNKEDHFKPMKLNFNGPLELIDNLVASERFKQCFAIKMYTYSWGQKPQGINNCSLAQAYDNMKKSNFSLLDMYKAILLHDQFFFRKK